MVSTPSSTDSVDSQVLNLIINGLPSIHGKKNNKGWLKMKKF